MFSEFIDGLLNFHFLQNALITALVIGIVGGAVGCFIILRGMLLMGDAISHAVLPCLLSTCDAADARRCVELGRRRSR